MASRSGLAGLVDLPPVNEYQASFGHVVGFAVNKVISFSLQQIIDLIFIVEMFAGHGKCRFPADTVNGNPIFRSLIDDLFHSVSFPDWDRVKIVNII